MAKRNLLSKLIAGIGALAMVATMMPAMAQPAKAADSVEVHKVGLTYNGNDTLKGKGAFGGRFEVAQITSEQYKEGMTAGEVGAASYETFAAPATIDSTFTFNTVDSDDPDHIYLLLRPNQYYEFRGLAGTGVTATDGARFWTKENTKDTKTNTWMIKIEAVANTFELSSVQPIELVVRVQVGEGITASLINGDSAVRGRTFTNDYVDYVMWWDESLSAATDVSMRTGNHVAATDNMLRVRTKDGNLEEISRPDDEGINTAAKQLETPTHDGERRLTFTASKIEGSSEMSMTINGTSIGNGTATSTHQLVRQSIAETVFDGTGADTTKYIELGDNTAASDLRPLSTNAAAPFIYNKEILDGQARFSVWWENLWALHFHGYYDNGAAAAVPANYYGADELTGRLAASAGNWFVKQTNGQRMLTIALGGVVKKGKVTFINGDALTAGSTLPNLYNREYVFRDENGKRFDKTVDSTVYSDDPATYEMKGLTQGDEIKFTVKVDNGYEIGDDWKVWLIDKNKFPTNITDLKDENGVYTVKLGDGFDYEIIAEKPTAKKTREVVNMPEADAVYNAGHEDYADPFYIRFGGFPFYGANNSSYIGWNSAKRTCNVAAPRYMFFLQANEEDDVYMNMFPFAVPRAVATADNDYIGYDFPVGTYKFKVRFANSFVGAGHGVFNETEADDRYAPASDFKITQDGTELKPDADGFYTLTVTEGDEPIVLKTENIARTYRVYAPNLAAYNISSNYDINRENYDDDVATGLANNFRANVPEGETFSFKIEPSDGTQKGPDFKVYLRAASDDLDRDESVVMTEIKEGADGSYSFTVYNDTEIVVSGMSGTGFNDVNNRSAEEQEAINYLKDAGVLEGYDDGSFRPGNNLTRAEFVTMLQRLQKGTDGTASFSDTASHWAAGAIGWASGQSLVNGYPDGSFRPGESITRAEVSQIMWKLNGSAASNIKADFSDVNQGAWYAPAVNWNYGKGIVKGYGDGRFGTNEPIERAHMALILYRAR